MQIRQIGVAAFFVIIAASVFATPTVVAFRPVSKPATRAPFNPQEIIAQTRLAQRCDSEPETPIATIPTNAVSRRLNTLIDEDQKARLDETVDQNSAERADQTRRQEVIQYILRNQLTTNTDFHNAGFIFHHGTCSDSFLLAHQLAGYAIALREGSTGNNKQAADARWLYAAAYDRYLRSNGLPQRFGTQYRFDGPDCQYVLEPFDPKTTNEERTLYEVATFEVAVALADAAKCP